MAIWQCDFYILPSNSDEAVLNLEIFDDSIFWHKVSVNKEIFNSVASVLPQVKSWSDSLDIYGNLEDSCMQISFDNNGLVDGALLRINFTSEYKDILKFIISFCIKNDFEILTSDLSKLPLLYSKIDQYIAGSKRKEKFMKLQKHI